MIIKMIILLAIVMVLIGIFVEMIALLIGEDVKKLFYKNNE